MILVKIEYLMKVFTHKILACGRRDIQNLNTSGQTEHGHDEVVVEIQYILNIYFDKLTLFQPGTRRQSVGAVGLLTFSATIHSE